jgi:hypothetical protein
LISIIFIGFSDIEILKNTVKMYASGVIETCEECAIAKAQQKNVNKNWLGSSERLYIDISSIKERSFGGAELCALIVNECPDYCYWIASPIFFTVKVTLVYGRISEDICYV